MAKPRTPGRDGEGQFERGSIVEFGASRRVERPRWADRSFVAVACGGGVLLAWWCSPNGLLQLFDSLVFFSTGSHLSHGMGLTSAFPTINSDLPFPAQVAANGRIPFTQWQPGYPALLGTLGVIGLRPPQAARLAVIAATGVLAASGAVAARRLLGLPFLGATAFVGIVLLRPNRFALDLPYLGGIGVALIEPVYAPLALLTVVIGCILLNRRNDWIAVAVVSGLVVLLVLVRPEGAAIGVAIAVGAWWLMHSQHDVGGRSRRRPIVLGLVGPFVLVAWPVLNGLLWGATSSVRRMTWHPSSQVFQVSVKALAGWFVGPVAPAPWRDLLIVLVAVVFPIVVAIVPAFNRRCFASDQRLALVAVVSATAIIGHWAMVVTTRTIFDRSTAIDGRHLAGVQPLGYLLVAAVFTGIVRRSRVPSFSSGRVGLVALSAAICVGMSWASLTKLPAARRQVNAVVARVDQSTSPVTVDSGITVVTNVPEVWWQATRQSSLLLPRPVSVTSGRKVASFNADLDDLTVLAHRRPVVVAVVTNGLPRGVSGALATKQLEGHHGFVRYAKCSFGLELWALRQQVSTVSAGAHCTSSR